MPKFIYLTLILLALACSQAPTLPDLTPPAPPPTVTPLPPPTPTPIPIAPPATPALSTAPCPFTVPANLSIHCGYLTVPAKHSQPQGATLKVAYAVLKANTPRLDPIVYLEGGPGGSPLDSLANDPEIWAGYSYLADRDLILLDQRGTGYSEPSLDCPEETAEEEEDPTQACYDRLLQEGIDLSAYNSLESAADVAALWPALGYKQVNLFGVSYGTRLALAVMRYHPAGIRSVVLDSAYAPNEIVPANEAKYTMNAMRRLFADCAAQPECAAAYPDLETVLLETVQSLNEADDPEITGDELMGTLFEAMYDVNLIPLLPRLIYEVSADNYDTYYLVAEGYTEDEYFEEDENFEEEEAEEFEESEEEETDPSTNEVWVDRSDSEGMYYAVSCNDEYPFSNFEQAEAQIKADVPPALHSYFSTEAMFDVCQTWGSGTAPTSENEAVVSDIPTLILAGEYDPVTPVEMNQLAARTLSRAQLYEFPGYGHALSSDPDCPTQMITEFFANPTQKVQTQCLEAMGETMFYLPDDELDY